MCSWEQYPVNSTKSEILTLSACCGSTMLLAVTAERGSTQMQDCCIALPEPSGMGTAAGMAVFACGGAWLMAICWADAMAEAEAEPGPTGAAAAEACMVRVGGWLPVGVARKRGLVTDQGWAGGTAEEVCEAMSPW